MARRPRQPDWQQQQAQRRLHLARRTGGRQGDNILQTFGIFIQSLFTSRCKKTKITTLTGNLKQNMLIFANIKNLQKMAGTLV